MNPMTQGRLEVRIVPCLSDNYTYLLTDVDTGATAVVDPGEAAPVAAALDAAGRKLDAILLTHHHEDHVAGVRELSGGDVQVVGAEADRHRLPPLDVALSPGDSWRFGAQQATVLDAPGHTVGQIAFRFPDGGSVFTGDSLFVMGCGRLFEGTAANMWETLTRIAALPADTRVFCGHEYTLSNADFCLSVTPEHEPTRRRAEALRSLRDRGEPTVPTTVGAERETNVFLRADAPDVRAAMALPDAPAAEVFAALRRRKDRG